MGSEQFGNRPLSTRFVLPMVPVRLAFERGTVSVSSDFDLGILPLGGRSPLACVCRKISAARIAQSHSLPKTSYFSRLANFALRAFSYSTGLSGQRVLQRLVVGDDDLAAQTALQVDDHGCFEIHTEFSIALTHQSKNDRLIG